MSFQNTKIDMQDKQKFYQLLIKQVKAVLHGENDLIANAANLSSLLFYSLDNVNWVGFYLLKNNQLILGPFQGQVACTKIPLGQGVCGTAFNQNKIQRIKDVNAFKGHITCDSISASEIVIPLNVSNKIIGVLDIDSPIIDRFDSIDEKNLKLIVKIFTKSIII